MNMPPVNGSKNPVPPTQVVGGDVVGSAHPKFKLKEWTPIISEGIMCFDLVPIGDSFRFSRSDWTKVSKRSAVNWTTSKPRKFPPEAGCRVLKIHAIMNLMQ